jgi:FkbM family methyltransferase
MNLTRSPLLRKLLLPLLRKLNPGDITIKNYYTLLPIRLHSYKHRGYWYRAESREPETMALFKELIHKGDIVFEVGGHIGFVTQLLSLLASDTGEVFVFEPGSNNLPYIRTNISQLKNTTLLEAAACDIDGEADFFLEDLSGQNNSLIHDFSTLSANEKSQNIQAKIEVQRVPASRLDTFARQLGKQPDFVKIDVEGAELSVLTGMEFILANKRPQLMVEVTYNAKKIFDLLSLNGYRLFSPVTKQELNKSNLAGNVFCLHMHAHSQEISRHFRE